MSRPSQILPCQKSCPWQKDTRQQRILPPSASADCIDLVEGQITEEHLPPGIGWCHGRCCGPTHRGDGRRETHPTQAGRGGMGVFKVGIRGWSGTEGVNGQPGRRCLPATWAPRERVASEEEVDLGWLEPLPLYIWGLWLPASGLKGGLGRGLGVLRAAWALCRVPPVLTPFLKDYPVIYVARLSWGHAAVCNLGYCQFS